jgi:hypothetical protein
MGRACSTYEGDEICMHNFGRRLLWRPRLRWGDNIKKMTVWIGFT